MTENASSLSSHVRHDVDGHQFVLAVEGSTAVLQYAEVDAGTVDFHHTFVPTALRGRGLASVLTEHGLRHARDHGLKVVPSCPFVATYIDRHPEYRSLVKA
jgi:predicted GNAT family acetyltransferase